MKKRKLKDNFLQSRKIAIIRTDRIGDMVLTLPMCSAIREVLPEAKITIIASQYVKELLDSCPVADDVFYCKNNYNTLLYYFKEQNFDAAFFPMPVYDEAKAAYKAGIPIRIGSAFRLYSYLYNYRIKEHRKISLYHEAEYNVRMLGYITDKWLKPKLVKPIESNYSKESIRELLKLNDFNEELKTVIIHPGSRGSSRDLSLNKFIELCNFLREGLKLNIIITGSRNEVIIANKIKESCINIINLAGKTNLSELVYLFYLSDLMIANSTGVLHVAAACGLNVIGFYPNTSHISSKRWGPYTEKAIIFSPPTSDNPNIRDNMELIETENVYKKILSLFSM
ncbi:MAG: hypothetical protein QG635_1768 [Bacteroidota bacterium]|nr:hypothetical protein [Bacteroidota bacterium]